MVKAIEIEKGIATIRGYFINPFIQYENGYVFLEGANPNAMEEVDVEMMRQNKWIWENDFWMHAI